jgi:integrase
MEVVSIPQFYHKQSGKRIEAFSLFIRNRSKGKTIYYARLRDRNGNQIPTPFSTERADKTEAANWVISHYDSLLNGYFVSAEYRTNKSAKILQTTVRDYFINGSKYLYLDTQFGIERSETRNREYASLINRFLIPYLNGHRLFHYNDVTAAELNKFQIECINNGISNKNITDIFYALKIIFNRLVMEGKMEHNAVNNIVLVKRKKAKEKGIFGIDEIEGLFDGDWGTDNEDAYLINLLSATTGLRNSEIRLLKTGGFEMANGVHFIDVKGTKTENAVRKVPLHKTVYDKIQRYIKNHKRDGFIFLRNGGRVYTAAEVSNMINIAGEKAGLPYSGLKERNITFHSWRHLYSTVLYADGNISSDWIEYFLGHKQTGVKGIYQHLNNIMGKTVCENVLNIVKDKIL